MRRVCVTLGVVVALVGKCQRAAAKQQQASKHVLHMSVSGHEFPLRAGNGCSKRGYTDYR